MSFLAGKTPAHISGPTASGSWMVKAVVGSDLILYTIIDNILSLSLLTLYTHSCLSRYITGYVYIFYSGRNTVSIYNKEASVTNKSCNSSPIHNILQEIQPSLVLPARFQSASLAGIPRGAEWWSARWAPLLISVRPIWAATCFL